MNSDQVAGQWKQAKGKIKEQWGKLTDDDLKVIEGNRDQLIGKIQERYGVTREVAQKQVEEWKRTHAA
ncbi:MAG: CsbD family protein [Terracidiphilus sp.]